MLGSRLLELSAALLAAASCVSAGKASRRLKAQRAAAKDLPIVDLGTQIQQATEYNITGDYFNFSNIRYAQAPLGELRFAEPAPLTGRNATINNGSVGRVCPQAIPDWLIIADLYIAAYEAGRPFNYTATEATLQADNYTHVAINDGRVNEDCLFLDIIVPRSVFSAASTTNVTYTVNSTSLVANATSLVANGTNLLNATTLLNDTALVNVTTLLANATTLVNATDLAANLTALVNATDLTANLTAVINGTALTSNATALTNATTATNATGSVASTGAPVMVWIHGGGYTEGSKTDGGDPAGLIKRSQEDGSDGIIYVSLNYRLGAFGWSAGPTFDKDGTPNVALYDQRLALQWVKENIAKFGGDPNRVTVFGESAGAGSIMHQITAFGGQEAAPFQKAILQSPAFQLVPNTWYGESDSQTFLGLLNVSSFEEARKLDSATLLAANLKQIQASPYGSFTYGPQVDGAFVPKLPGTLLEEGKFDSSVEVMVGHNSDEGRLFTDPTVLTNAQFDAGVAAQFVNATNETLNYITQVLYPPVFNGTYGYTDQIGRNSLLTADSSFTCNTDYLNRAFDNETYSYLFAVGAGIHGSDVPYTYFNGANDTAASSSIIAPKTAVAMQKYFTSFAKIGIPIASGAPTFPIHGANATELVFNSTSIYTKKDETANARCAWWQAVKYTPEQGTF